MKTQISVLVKNESVFSKAMTLLWFINNFKKSRVNLILDGTTHTLKASKQMHTFDVAPGSHTLEFLDPKAGQKNFQRKMTGALVGGSLGLATGSGLGGLEGAAVGTKVGEAAIQENIVNCTLAEGDHFKVSCKANRKGGIKIKQIKEKN